MIMKKIVLALLCFTGPIFADLDPSVKSPRSENIESVMLVGNSFFYYNNSMHHYLGALVKHDPDIQSLKRRSITINGSSLSWHDMDSYINNKQLGSFSIDTNNDNKYVKNPFQKVDAVIMMDCSLCPVHKDTKNDFHKYVKQHSDTIRENEIEPMLIMTWPYKNRPEMIHALRKEFLQATNENNILLIPVGEAFYLTNNTYPEINLYQADNRHPSVAGTYLAAAVIFGSLFQRKTEGNSALMGLSKEETFKLQKIADQTVRDFFQRN